jgi:hypothetical protein
MQTQIDAIFEDGVLKPVVKLDLPEHARVHVVVSTADTNAPPGRPLPGWPRYTPADLHLADPSVSIEEVRAALAKIPGSMVDELREMRRSGY